MGIIGFAFASLQMLSSKTEEIYERTKEAISKKMASLPLGLQEQYKIQLERLRTAPGCEIISIPGGLSSPSLSLVLRYQNIPDESVVSV